MTEEDEGVGQRRLAAAAVVARRAGKGARALRTDLEDVAQLHRRDAAAAGADGFDVDGVRAQRVPRHRVPGGAASGATVLLRAAVVGGLRRVVPRWCSF